MVCFVDEIKFRKINIENLLNSTTTKSICRKTLILATNSIEGKSKAHVPLC